MKLKKKLQRDKERHYIIIEGSIHQQDITIINVYAANVRVPKYIFKN